MSEKYHTGDQVRRDVLGDAHVRRTSRDMIPEEKPFQDLITESAWGTVWASDAISRRERSMVTLALLAAAGNPDELELHLRACARTGTTKSDVMEVLQHVAIYAGLPRANAAIKVAKLVWATHATDR